MRKIDLGQTISILANFGVFAGVLLLVYELAQNRQMMRSQIRNDLNAGLMSYQLISADEQISEIMERAQNDGGLQNLSDVERRRFEVVRGMQARYFENVHYQFRVGLYDDNEFARQKIAWGNYMNRSARAPKIWCEYQHVVSVEFAAELNALLSSDPCN